ncbi:hypothetical protein, partial [Escherichia coli]|uniref:hypothetical protein n=1 Tax=Escherichia coli TaxID=562 RepID=UPI001BC8573A
FPEVRVLVFPYQPQLMCFMAPGSAIKGTGIMKKRGYHHPRYKEVLTIMETLMKIFSATLYGE